MLQPFTRKDLMTRSLPDRINDYEQMTFLYPNVPKHQVSLSQKELVLNQLVFHFLLEKVFGKYYSQTTEGGTPRHPRTGYVSHHLVNVIQG